MFGNPSKVDAKRGDYSLQRDLEPPEAIPRATRETIWGDRGEDAPSLGRLRRVLGKMSLRQRELVNIQFSLFMPQIEQPVRLRGAFMLSVGLAEPRIHFEVAEESGNRVRA
jgi:hypothetical protein